MKRTADELERAWMLDRIWRGSEWSDRRRKRLALVFQRAMSRPVLLSMDALLLAEEAIAAARVSSAVEVAL